MGEWEDLLEESRDRLVPVGVEPVDIELVHDYLSGEPFISFTCPVPGFHPDGEAHHAVMAPEDLDYWMGHIREAKLRASEV